ncbi:hypothetical protein AMTRI_Chr11g153210 [Amborella trichopoda]
MAAAFKALISSETLPLLRSLEAGRNLSACLPYGAKTLSLSQFQHALRAEFEKERSICRCSSDSTTLPGSSSQGSDEGTDSVPTPIVLIDQDSDKDSTVVEISFGDRLGALVDTVRHTGRKVEDPDMLERIRLTIINNLLKYHPESSERLALGEAFGIKAPQKKLDVDIATHIHVKDDGPKRSLLIIETADRPGLLMEIVKILADVNVSVESAEIDTEGLIAKDRFHVSYRGAALNSSLSEVLTNCLRYYLRRPETDDDSY